MKEQIYRLNTLRKLFYRTRLLRHLELFAYRDLRFSFADLYLFVNEMPLLVELHLILFESLDVDCMKYVVLKAPNLEHLNIEGGTRVYDSYIKEISHLVMLMSLDVSCCELITDAGLIQFAREIRCLHFLNIEDISSISARYVTKVEICYQTFKNLLVLKYLGRLKHV